MSKQPLTSQEIEEFRREFGLEDWILAEKDPRNHQFDKVPLDQELLGKVSDELNKLHAWQLEQLLNSTNEFRSIVRSAEESFYKQCEQKIARNEEENKKSNLPQRAFGCLLLRGRTGETGTGQKIELE